MQFSDTTNKNGIIQNIESLCQLGDAGVSGNTTLFAKMTGWVNQGYQKIAIALAQADKKWKWDDFNNTDFPRAAATLIASQQDYSLPAATASGNASTLLGINKICVLDINSDEKILTLTDVSEAILNNRYPDAGLPTVYKLLGNSVKMWPSPASAQTTLTSGLIVYFNRTATPFTVSSTTTQPGFTASYHDLLELYASAQYLLPSDTKLASSYLTLFNNRLSEFLDTLPHMNDDSPNRIIIRHRSSR